VVAGAPPYEHVIPVVGDKRFYNATTGTHPCVLHVAGGYTSPTEFKDAQVGPWWDAIHLGIGAKS
jgi:hypothetical protein